MRMLIVLLGIYSSAVSILLCTIKDGWADEASGWTVFGVLGIFIAGGVAFLAIAEMIDNWDNRY